MKRGGKQVGGNGTVEDMKKKETRVIEEMEREGRFCKRMIHREVKIC